MKHIHNLAQTGTSKIVFKYAADLYIRIAFHYESTVDRLLGKGLLDKDSVDYHRKTFYDSLDEEKLRTSQTIGSQIEIMQRYVRAGD